MIAAVTPLLLNVSILAIRRKDGYVDRQMEIYGQVVCKYASKAFRDDRRVYIRTLTLHYKTACDIHASTIYLPLVSLVITTNTTVYLSQVSPGTV